MAKPKNGTAKRIKPHVLQIELIPIPETENEFQARKEEVQILVTDMFLRLKKKGRPSTKETEESYAA